jgi:hypothetical protein
MSSSGKPIALFKRPREAQGATPHANGLDRDPAPAPQPAPAEPIEDWRSPSQEDPRGPNVHDIERAKANLERRYQEALLNPANEAERDIEPGEPGFFDDDAAGVVPAGAAVETEVLAGDNDEAIRFLELWWPGEAWQVLAFTPERGEIDPATGEPLSPDGGDFTQPDRARRCVDKWQGKRGLYFSINRTRRGLAKKAAKSEITELRALHVDLDLPKRADINLAMEQANILDRLKGHQPPPSAIIFSGGGYWGLWRLREPVAVRDVVHAEDLERYNIALAEALGGDNCHNIDRIARLPGTINLPNKVKREAGRVPALATFQFYPERVYTLADFTPAPAGSRKRQADTGQAGSGHERIRDAGRTPSGDGRPSTTSELCEIIRLGHDPQNPQRWTRETDGTLDRNRAVLYVACALARTGWTREQIADELLDERNGIAAHVYDQADPERAAWRAIDFAFEALARDAARDAKPPQRPRNGDARERDDDTARRRSATINAASLHGSAVPQRRWLIPEWIPWRRVTALYGHGGEGKTTLFCQLQTAAARGDDWLGLPVTAGRSLGLYCEDDDQEVHIRQEIINRHYGHRHPTARGGNRLVSGLTSSFTEPLDGARLVLASV